jgi:hypothetical protein
LLPETPEVDYRSTFTVYDLRRLDFEIKAVGTDKIAKKGVHAFGDAVLDLSAAYDAEIILLGKVEYKAPDGL